MAKPKGKTKAKGKVVEAVESVVELAQDVKRAESNPLEAAALVKKQLRRAHALMQRVHRRRRGLG